MFVFNIKVNSNKIKKVLQISIIAIVIVTILLLIYNYFIKKNSTFKVNDDIPNNELINILPQDYTNILQEVHMDLDFYIGRKIRFSGYIYKVYDFKDNQFVLARNMIISSDFQTVVVGFLCENDQISDFSENTWIEIEGIITKGNYHGTIPIVTVNSLKEIEKPVDEYVYPPE